MLLRLLIWYMIASSGFSCCVGRGTSMDRTFADGQVLVLREVIAYSHPHAGDIVTFHADKLGKIIKRVVAVAGDTVEVMDHQLYINHEPMGIEGYIDTLAPLTIEEGEIFAVGDNYWSVDSRVFGPIPTESIEDIFVLKLPIVMPHKKGEK